MNALDVMKISPIVPVIALDDENDALRLAEALLEGGISIMEITLRTPAGLKAIEAIAKAMPEMHVGAGTVCNVHDMRQAIEHGSGFLFSPGISQELIESAKAYKIAFIPGVATASEVMLAQNSGLMHAKLFPATVAGGVSALKAFGGPFGEMRFCPTGGVSLSNLNDFLALENVICVGGSWIVPKEALVQQDFKSITALTKEALSTIR
ncbi:MAG: bifunctional 4-hydroxy-2-oxoglutarate aldolase/2-dehydro-3-deoxy-phosphogluconate aldolase [Helicobacteraceae bacterium]|jgi:2-dehydro-3-deoxyphosphogluconate aldolase/(4S)-4-hydroxy-2-oxoglutarate aldolase|nr:bifunctional 4-hydroxy-2-oxoglutarate aldolase/2-dehydro-3-deoxy-phosphogluconate aldolase [Helicobacteraceae bacterium]